MSLLGRMQNLILLEHHENCYPVAQVGTDHEHGEQTQYCAEEGAVPLIAIWQQEEERCAVEV